MNILKNTNEEIKNSNFDDEIKYNENREELNQKKNLDFNFNNN